MAESIETFVNRLQSDGVEAGRKEAHRLKEEAQAQADQIIAQAKSQAETIVAEANAEADNVRARSRTELELAARDVILRLREALNRALTAVLTGETREKLTDGDFLGKLLNELVTLYANAKSERGERISVNVPQELHDELGEWALKRMREQADDKLGVDLHGTLKTAGFEYTVSGATVEVTLDSVVETLKRMVSPRLAEVIDQAAGELRHAGEAGSAASRETDSQ